MSLEQDVTAARQALDDLEQACASLTRHVGETVDARRLRNDIGRVRDDLDLLSGLPSSSIVEPFAGVYGDGDDEGFGGAGRTGR
jgi:hypothetical protein